MRSPSRNDVSRQLWVRCSCPWRVNPIIPDDPSTLFDFELGDEHRLRDPAGHRVRSRPSKEIATNRQGEAARNLNRSSASPRWISSISSRSSRWQKPRSYSLSLRRGSEGDIGSPCRTVVRSEPPAPNTRAPTGNRKSAPPRVLRSTGRAGIARRLIPAADLTAQNPEVIRDEMQSKCLDVSWKNPSGNRSKESTG